ARNHTYSVTPVMYGTIMGVSVDFFRTRTGTIKVSVNGTMEVYVGTGFTAVLDYVQHNVSASFQAPPPDVGAFDFDELASDDFDIAPFLIDNRGMTDDDDEQDDEFSNTAT